MKRRRHTNFLAQCASFILRSARQSAGVALTFQAATLVIIMLTLSACSVGMAVGGDDQPDLVVAQVGASKEKIDAEFSPPTKIEVREDGGAECLYIFVLGDERSYSRAVLHAGLDALTIGLWEVVGTPIERHIEETQEYQMTVVYDINAIARSVKIQPIGRGRQP